MFEEDAKNYAIELTYPKFQDNQVANIVLRDVEGAFQKGAEFGYDKGKEELTERLDNATEIIELMKGLFFDCWQEKGIEAIKFEQRVNDFLKGDE